MTLNIILLSLESPPPFSVIVVIIFSVSYSLSLTSIVSLIFPYQNLFFFIKKLLFFFFSYILVSVTFIIFLVFTFHQPHYLSGKRAYKFPLGIRPLILCHCYYQIYFSFNILIIFVAITQVSNRYETDITYISQRKLAGITQLSEPCSILSS